MKYINSYKRFLTPTSSQYLADYKSCENYLIKVNLTI